MKRILGTALAMIFFASVGAAQSAGTFVIEPDRAAVSEPLPCPPPNICDTFAGFLIHRVGGATGPVGVTVSIAGGTATYSPDGISGDYYLGPPLPDSFTWGDGDTADRKVNIFVIQDHLLEPNETVILGLSNPTGGATIGSSSTATMIILDTSAQVQGVPGLGHWAMGLLAAGVAAIAVLRIQTIH